MAKKGGRLSLSLSLRNKSAKMSKKTKGQFLLREGWDSETVSVSAGSGLTQEQEQEEEEEELNRNNKLVEEIQLPKKEKEWRMMRKIFSNCKSRKGALLPPERSTVRLAKRCEEEEKHGADLKEGKRRNL